MQEQALQFIRRHRERPFFAYLPTTLPHVELVVPEDSERPYRGKFPRVSLPDPRPGYLGSEDGYTTYAGMVSRLDRHVGQVLDLLKELKLEENTLVLFTSDNGPQGGKPWDTLVEFFDGNGPLRGSKGDFYEGGLREPLLARWPGHVRPGTVTEQPVAFWDFLPTVAEVAGAPAPAETDGISFLPTLTGKEGQKQHDYFYWEYPYPKGYGQACRLGEWKAVVPRPQAPLELYDLKTDAAESRDVASQHPDVVRQAREVLATAHHPERIYQEEKPPVGIRDYVR